MPALTSQPLLVLVAGDRCARHRIGDGEVVAADPPAAGLAINQPGVIRDADSGSQGRDPPVVGSQQDRSNAWANNSVGRSIGVCNPVEVPFNTENEISELIVVSELASSDECSVVVYAVAQAQAEETVGHVTSAPGSTDVGAEVESSPTEGRSHIDWRRRIDRRTRANFSGIRSHRKCQQRCYGGGRMEQLAHGSSPHFE